MFEIPYAAVAASQMMQARADLRGTLGREPTANECQRFLGWPERVGEVTVKPWFYQVGGGTSAAIPGTPYRVHLEKTMDGDIRITLTDRSYLDEAKADG